MIVMETAQKKIKRMTVLAIYSAALIAPLAVLAQDTPATPPLPPAGQTAGGGPGGSSRGPSSLSPEEREQRQLDALNDRLTLTADQQTQIKQVLVDRDAKLAALRDDDSVAPEDKRAKAADITQDSSAKIRALLTPDQQPQYDDFLAHQRQRGQGRGGNGGYGTPPPPSAPPPSPGSSPSPN
jgi:periplasmic protein CpxP/Spy